MQLHLQGVNIPEAFLDSISALTDHAVIHPHAIRYDDPGGSITLPITRYPLRKERAHLGNIHDQDHPIEAEVVIKHVLSYEVKEPVDLQEQQSVTLHFGIRLANNTVAMYSAEEVQGISCFSLVIDVSSYDIVLTDL